MVAKLLHSKHMDEERLARWMKAMIANLMGEGNLSVDHVSVWSEQGVDDSNRLMT